MSRKNHKWTQSDIDKLLKMRADGKSNAEAAEYFGCSRQNICNTITRHTENLPPRPKLKPKTEHFCKGCWAGTFTDEGIYKCMFPKHCERKDGCAILGIKKCSPVGGIWGELKNSRTNEEQGGGQ